MEEIGIFEAKTHFSEIAKRVKDSGQSVRITSRGEEMVDIVPIVSHPKGRRTRDQAILELTRLRDELPKSSFEQIMADIAVGRH